MRLLRHDRGNEHWGVRHRSLQSSRWALLTGVLRRLIAIMLGRLQMSVKECRLAHRDLADNVFQVRNYRVRPRLRLPWNWSLNARFDSEALKKGIKRIVLTKLRERPENKAKKDEELEGTLLKEDNPKCRVYVRKVFENRRSLWWLTTFTQLRYRNKRVHAGPDHSPHEL